MASRLAVTATCVLLSGCAGGLRPAQPVPPDDALSIEYNLPITSARATIELVLLDCPATGPLVRPSVALQPVSSGNADVAGRFRLHTTALSSWTKNRQVAVELHGNGAIKSVNGAVTDRTGAIIGNVLKSLTSLVGLLDQQAERTTVKACNAATRKALADIATLGRRVEILRGEIATAPPARTVEIKAAIDALAAEAARIRTERLLVTVPRDLTIFGGPHQGSIAIDATELARWTDPASATPLTNLRLTYCVDRPDAEGECSPTPTGPVPRPTMPAGADCAKYDCQRTIVLREPVIGRLRVVTASGDFAGMRVGRQLAELRLPVSQWGTLSYIPLTAGFGESRSFALGLDEFGRRTSFTWKTDARGEGFTGGVAGVVDATSALVTRARGRDLAEQQAEITELQTQQTLNRLRFCREVIAAGGFTCPSG